MSIFVTDIATIKQLVRDMSNRDILLEHISAILSDDEMTDDEKVAAIQRVVSDGVE